ncbi:MAG: MerR family transcriptional regulator [Prevotella sp.]|nr:MerR family transcriptional regulator [Prevotella sp.]MCM1075532.1 MerR family transcriptional regulator [Ruminococcus sp.]
MADKLDKQYYKIKEVADMIGVPQSTLRFWEKEFPNMINPMRSSTNLRYYRPKDIENVKIIHFLIKEKGLKIEAAKAYLRSNAGNVSKVPEVIERLEDVRDELNQLLKALGGRWTKSQGLPENLPTEIS